MIVVELIYDLSILIAISVLSGFLDQRFKRSEKSGKILQGLLFGTVAIIGMVHPFVVAEGIIVDGRSIVIGICTLFFGPLSGGIAAVFAIIYRLYIGGAGTLMGTLVILVSYVLGYLFFLRKNSSTEKLISYKELYIFGLLVHVAMLVLVLTLPLGNIKETYREISFTLLALFPLVTLLLGKILLDQENSNLFVNELKIGEKKYRDLFEANKDGITIFYINPDETVSNIVEANETAAIMLGYNKEDIVGKHPSEFEIERDAAELENRKLEILQNGHASIETSLRHKDGHLIPVEIKVVHLFYENRPAIMNIVRDVSERKEYVSSLLKKEERFRLLVKNSSDIIVILDAEGKQKYVSPAAERITGFSVDELTGKSLSEVIHPDDISVINKIWEEEIANPEKIYTIQYRHKHKTKGWVYLEATGQNFLNEPAVNGIVASVRDISQAKKQIEELQRNQYHLSKAQEIGSIGTWELDLKQNILTWTDENYRIFSVPVGTPMNYELFINSVHPEDRKYVSEEWKAALDGKPYDIEHRLLVEGKVRWVREKAEMEFDNDGKAIKGIGFTQDITERKELFERLKENEERFRLLFDQAPLGYQSLDENGNFLTINKAWLDTLGYCYEDVKGKSFGNFLAPKYKEAFIERFPQFKSAGKIHTEFEMVHKNGSYRYISFEGRIGFNNDGSFKQTHCILSDMTEERRAKLALTESEEKHRQMIANISDVIGIMSADGIIRYKSPNIEKWFGWQPKDLIGTNGWDTVHPEDMEWIKKEFFDLFQEDNKTKNVEYRYKCKDGSYKLIELTAVNLTKNSAINGVLMNYCDISNRKQAETAIRNSEKEYKSTINELLTGVLVHAADTSILLCNAEATRILGLTEIQMAGKEAADPDWYFVNTDLTRMDLEDYPVNKVISDGKLFHDYSVGINRPDRDYITWVNVNAVPLFNENKKLEKIIVNFVDVTNSKLTQEELNKKAEQFTIITETSNEGFWRVDLMGNLKEVNDIYCNMLGYSRDELLCMSITDLEVIENKEDTKHHIQKLKQLGFDKFETQHRCKDGKIIEMDASATYSKNLEMIMVFFTDITERKKVEKELKEQMEEITRFNKLMVGRENKMIELKEEINELLEKEGKLPKYSISGLSDK